MIGLTSITFRKLTCEVTAPFDALCPALLRQPDDFFPVLPARRG